MSMLDNLKKGMDVLVMFVGLFVTIYATLFIGLLVLGVVTQIVASGNVNVSGTYDANNTSNNDGIAGSIYDAEQGLQSNVSALTNPITVLTSLIVVGVLTAFIKFGGREKQGVQ